MTKKTKEIKIGVRIGENDLNTKIRNINKLISKGHMIKLVIQMRGREKGNFTLSRPIIDRVKSGVKGAKEAGTPSVKPDRIQIYLSPVAQLTEQRQGA